MKLTDGNTGTKILHLHIPADMHEAIRQQAFLDRTSQATWVRTAIDEKMERDGIKKNADAE